MLKHLATLFVASTALYAAEADPMAEPSARLLSALEQEVTALESIQSAADASAVVQAVRESLLAQEDLFSVDATELWLYIDNTPGVKQPLVDALVRLAVQFERLKAVDFFDNAELRTLLSPQVIEDEGVRNARKEKLQTIDHDED